MQFKIWLENAIARRNGTKDSILDFLKTKVKINDDGELLSMPLKSIDSQVVGELLNLGMVSNADENLMNDIKNGSLTVGEMIDRIAGVKTPAGF